MRSRGLFPCVFRFGQPYLVGNRAAAPPAGTGGSFASQIKNERARERAKQAAAATAAAPTSTAASMHGSHHGHGHFPPHARGGAAAGAGDGGPAPRGPAPVAAPEISALLNALPCALSMRRDDTVSVTLLVKESRRLVANMRQCFQFLLLQAFMLAGVSLLASLCILPPITYAVHVLWLCWVPLPLVALALLALPAEPGRSRACVMAGKKLADHAGGWACAGLMQRMTFRTKSHLDPLRRSLLYLAARWVF